MGLPVQKSSETQSPDIGEGQKPDRSVCSFTGKRARTSIRNPNGKMTHVDPHVAIHMVPQGYLNAMWQTLSCQKLPARQLRHSNPGDGAIKCGVQHKCETQVPENGCIRFWNLAFFMQCTQVRNPDPRKWLHKILEPGFHAMCMKFELERKQIFFQSFCHFVAECYNLLEMAHLQQHSSCSESSKFLVNSGVEQVRLLQNI